MNRTLKEATVRRYHYDRLTRRRNLEASARRLEARAVALIMAEPD
jgi:hypothetical protein